VNRRVRLLVALILLIVALVVAIPMAFGAAMLNTLTHPGCAHAEIPDNDQPQSVSFTTPRGFTLRGFFLPGTNGATVIVVPTMGNDRAVGLPIAQTFNQAGFNVLTFDAGTCDGARYHSLGYTEAEDVVAAYDYLKTRSDIDPARVSLHGFSSAGATSLFAAARIPPIQGVSVEGNYANFAEQLGIGQDGGLMEQLIRLGATLSYRLTTGLDVRQLDPLDAVDAIAPRPILFVYGSREVSLPGARLMLAQAQSHGSDAELWIVDGSGHGGYLAAAGDTYLQKLVDFHRAIASEP
jgi:dipeptidyl aminopeptidase/acylaminoacyl peptidase